MAGNEYSRRCSENALQYRGADWSFRWPNKVAEWSEFPPQGPLADAVVVFLWAIWSSLIQSLHSVCSWFEDGPVQSPKHR